MKAALNLGANFWNAGEIYGTPDYNSLHLLKAYFTKYPEDADKVIINIKGGYGGVPPNVGPDGSPEGAARSVENCLKVLNGTKFIDVFEYARVDPKVPIETTLGALSKYVESGKIGGIGLSEVSAATIHRAVKVHKIASVEIELSLFSTEVLTNGISAACAEYDIPMFAYSPLGRGFLTGQIKSLNDIPEGDFRRTVPRYFPENFDDNLKLVREVEEVAAREKVTPAQVSLAWVKALAGKAGMPKTIVPIPGATTIPRLQENFKVIDLSKAEIDGLDAILEKFEVKGGRYSGAVAALSNG